jgi:hypothetical protein
MVGSLSNLLGLYYLGVLPVSGFMGRPSKLSISIANDRISGLYCRKYQNPKDMAYGVWAVLRKRGAIDLQEPTYTRDLSQIYWTLTVHLVQVTGSLNLPPLAAARGQLGLSSWVPDWWVQEAEVELVSWRTQRRHIWMESALGRRSGKGTRRRKVSEKSCSWTKRRLFLRYVPVISALSAITSLSTRQAKPVERRRENYTF